MLYAIKTSPQQTTWLDMLSVWQTADDMEVFHSAWNFDHFYPINVPDTTGPCMEAWVTLTALAQATKRIRIGCLVSGVVYRHPTLIANMAASLDIISNGRLELGLGAGWNEEECDAYGIDLGTMTERFDRFDESLEVIHSMLTQEVSNFSGKYFTLTEARNNPPPIQKPHPPILIGGNGEKRTLPSVAKWAQHWNYAAFDLEGFIEKRKVLHACCADIGRDPSEIMTSIHQSADMDKLDELEESCRNFKDAGLGLMVFYLPPPHSADVLAPLAAIAERVG
ncbi:MAG: LLM class F420-dependent oxidoreductase [Alphaproteobacteria bacterium]|nr:MAG: LLM class F420-dependent oxidoreductase [Alphaproteobacteria bacterium]